MVATAALIEELAATWEVWADAGRRLPEAAWQAPTRLPGWNVRDLRYAGLLTVTVCCALQVGVVESTVHLLDLRAALAELASVTVAVPTSALAVTRDVLAAIPDPVAFIEAATGRTSRSILPVLR